MASLTSSQLVHSDSVEFLADLLLETLSSTPNNPSVSALLPVYDVIGSHPLLTARIQQEPLRNTLLDTSNFLGINLSIFSKPGSLRFLQQDPENNASLGQLFALATATPAPLPPESPPPQQASSTSVSENPANGTATSANASQPASASASASASDPSAPRVSIYARRKPPQNGNAAATNTQPGQETAATPATLPSTPAHARQALAALTPAHVRGASAASSAQLAKDNPLKLSLSALLETRLKNAAGNIYVPCPLYTKETVYTDTPARKDNRTQAALHKLLEAEAALRKARDALPADTAFPGIDDAIPASIADVILQARTSAAAAAAATSAAAAASASFGSGSAAGTSTTASASLNSNLDDLAGLGSDITLSDDDDERSAQSQHLHYAQQQDNEEEEEESETPSDSPYSSSASASASRLERPLFLTPHNNSRAATTYSRCKAKFDDAMRAYHESTLTPEPKGRDSTLLLECTQSTFKKFLLPVPTLDDHQRLIRYLQDYMDTDESLRAVTAPHPERRGDKGSTATVFTSWKDTVSTLHTRQDSDPSAFRPLLDTSPGAYDALIHRDQPFFFALHDYLGSADKDDHLVPSVLKLIDTQLDTWTSKAKPIVAEVSRTLRDALKDRSPISLCIADIAHENSTMRILIEHKRNKTMPKNELQTAMQKCNVAPELRETALSAYLDSLITKSAAARGAKEQHLSQLVRKLLTTAITDLQSALPDFRVPRHMISLVIVRALRVPLDRLREEVNDRITNVIALEKMQYRARAKTRREETTAIAARKADLVNATHLTPETLKSTVTDLVKRLLPAAIANKTHASSTTAAAASTGKTAPHRGRSRTRETAPRNSARTSTAADNTTSAAASRAAPSPHRNVTFKRTADSRQRSSSRQPPSLHPNGNGGRKRTPQQASRHATPQQRGGRANSSSRAPPHKHPASSQRTSNKGPQHGKKR